MNSRGLQEAVTIVAKRAAGEDLVPASLVPQVGDAADFVILHDNDSVQSAALSPCYARTTIKAGAVVARRQVTTYIRMP
jgi:hypothetical protein